MATVGSSATRYASCCAVTRNLSKGTKGRPHSGLHEVLRCAQVADATALRNDTASLGCSWLCSFLPPMCDHITYLNSGTVVSPQRFPQLCRPHCQWATGDFQLAPNVTRPMTTMLNLHDCSIGTGRIAVPNSSDCARWFKPRL